MLIKKAIGFVDWNTAVIASGAKVRARRPDAMAEKALRHVENVISDFLIASACGSSFRVRLRLYAGWNSGKTPTEYHQGISSIMETYASKTRYRRDHRIRFLPGRDGIQLGDKLACVPDRRLAHKHGVHCLDTLRWRTPGDTWEEKMVDIALVVDLLSLARRKKADRYMVISDDDDMFPGIFAAESAGADVRMLSRRGRSKWMAHAKDLVHTY